MERNELKGKQTPGLYRAVVQMVLGDRKLFADCTVAEPNGSEYDYGRVPTTANAALYAEAHNVANETGMWPLDMVERIKELEAASGDPGFWGRVAAWNGQRAAELEEALRVALNDLRQAQEETHIDFRGSIELAENVLNK